MTVTRPYHVAIIGGGVTGLSCAWHLQQQATEASLDVTYTLLESSDRWGGKIRTDTVDGYADTPFVVEGGPDSVLTQKPWAIQMARQMGLGERLWPTNDDRRQTFVVHKGKPMPLPDGVLLIVPTKIKPFALSPLISPLGKLRMGLDLFIPPKTDGEDETLADFMRRRLGAEALDKLAEPLLSGIYNADAEKQSLLATFPRFRDLEVKYGSLMKGMLASRKARPSPPKNGQKSSMFTSFRNGMQELVDGILPHLQGDLRLGTAVQSIQPLESGYHLTLQNGETLDVDAVVLAIPAFAAAELIKPFRPQAAEDLQGIRYVSTGTISLAYRREEIGHPLNGFGIVIPRSEKRCVNAITWSSTKFNNRAPDGFVLLRAFFGGSRTPEMMTVGDDKLLATVCAELESLMGVNARPLFHKIYRWTKSNPQYDVGHLDRIERIEAAMPSGLFVTGSPYRGVGVPDCVRQAQQTAVKIIQSLPQPA
ncbi:MAG: protoporphyrinogen oxidase [Anaerolineae bacterium]